MIQVNQARGLVRKGMKSHSSVAVFTGLSLLAFVPGAEAEIVFLPLPGLSQAREWASTLHCVSNLKQIAIAARVYANDNADRPPTNFLNFTAELVSPSILFCPADPSTQPPTNWAEVDWSKVNYEWVAPLDWLDPAQLCARCKVHRNQALVEGSVQALGGFLPGWAELVAGPLDQYASPGSTVRFQAVVAPDALEPLSYQWRRETPYPTNIVTFIPDPDVPGTGHWTTNSTTAFEVTPLPGETKSECLLVDVSTNSSGYYSVSVSNSLGTAVSRAAGLKVSPDVEAMATNSLWAEIICLSNLRQIGLLASLRTEGPGGALPADFASMTNRHGSPVFEWPLVLFCRADTNHTPTLDWGQTDFAHTSYEMFPPDPGDPGSVYCRCQVHGFYLRSDLEIMSQPRFNSVKYLASRGAEVSLRAFAGRTNVLESSADLVNWDTLATYPPSTGDYVFQDERQLARRFYRVRLP